MDIADGECWQPIETAPKTGRILVWNSYFGVYSSEYVEERELEEGKAFSECRLKWSGYPLGIAEGRLGKWYCEPTLWKPLPKFPNFAIAI